MLRRPTFVVRRPSSAVRGPPSAVRGPPSAFRRPRSAVRRPRSAVRLLSTPESILISMVDKLIKLTRIGKYRHNNNKGFNVDVFSLR
jgi:hypothetical protein